MALVESSYLVQISPVPRVSRCVLTSRVICHAHGSVSPPPRSRYWLAPSQACSCAFIATASSLPAPDLWQTLIGFTYLPLPFHVCYRNSSTLYVSFWDWLFYLVTFLWSSLPSPPTPPICVPVVVGVHSWVVPSVGAPVSLDLSKTCSLSFILFVEQRVWIAMQSSSSVFLFTGRISGVQSSSSPRSQRFSPRLFFSKGFTVLPITFRSVIHMELICV